MFQSQSCLAAAAVVVVVVVVAAPGNLPRHWPEVEFGEGSNRMKHPTCPSQFVPPFPEWAVAAWAAEIDSIDFVEVG